MKRKHRPFASMWLRRTLGPCFFVALYAAGVSGSWANEDLKLEYLIFTHQGLSESSREQDTRHNHLLALDELSSSDTVFGRGHSLLSGSGILKAYKTRLSASRLYRVTLHAQAVILTSGKISPIRFRVKRKGVPQPSDIRIVFQYKDTQHRPITTSVIYTPRSGEALKSEETVSRQPQETQPVPWIVRDSRRLVLGKVQYLAHPNFGMLFVLAENR